MRCLSFSLPSLIVLCPFLMGAPLGMASPVKVATPSACPVELAASQAAMGELAYAAPVSDNEAAPLPRTNSKSGQAFELSIKNSRLQRIVAAELEVHGTTPKNRILRTQQASSAQGPVSDAVRNVHLDSSVPAEEERSQRVSVEHLSSVAWVNVIELQYADGSTWHAGPGRLCRVEPDPVMAVRK